MSLTDKVKVEATLLCISVDTATVTWILPKDIR
jgi:hypothetical protein